jgi:hypothetical protein
MTSLNLASNGLGEIVLAAGWRSRDDDGRGPWIGPDGQEQNEKPGKPEGIIAIANAIPNMGALSVLNLSNCELWEEWTFSSDQWWCNGDYPFGYGKGKPCKKKPAKTNEGFMSLCNAIKDNGALSVLSLKSNNLHADGGKALAEGLKGNTVITELDISGNDLGWDSNYVQDTSGVIALADAIPDMGALIKLDISSNYIAAAQGEDLQRICAASGIELAR